MSICMNCDGEGFQHPECPECGANRGWVIDFQGGIKVCPECEGESDEECLTCEGYGTLD
jgi:predicted amidophosphoribosyltransferase